MLLGLFVTAFALMACSSDDEEDNNNPLVGTWILKSPSSLKELGWIDFNQITLKNDGTGEFPGMKPGYYVGWKVDGSTLRIDFGQGHPDDGVIGTYVINGNTLTYTGTSFTDPNNVKWDGRTDFVTVWERK